ncbi:MAG: hypothetical protein A3G35_16630 [candidate division NC10 bacterium RIFCSPLOWO2_12_FULL_66_18]|nr:MAG: hypothetical protein A3G35_16630 [candidate division NC10 bacterium RIFCSPLOWO2_12_FULL_66_18]
MAILDLAKSLCRVPSDPLVFILHRANQRLHCTGVFDPAQGPRRVLPDIPLLILQRINQRVDDPRVVDLA